MIARLTVCFSLFYSLSFGQNLLFTYFETQQPDPSGLVAYYPFNGNANDESSNGFNGTVYGATLDTNRFGEANSAYLFNNFDSIISSASLLNDTAYSISLWFKDNTGGSVTFKGLVSWGSSVTSRKPYTFVNNFNGNYRYANAIIGATNYTLFSSTQSQPVNEWIHLVFVWSNNELSIYINNVKETTTLSTPLASLDSEQNMHIGGSSDGTTAGGGVIDDIYIFNIGLTASEINDLYTEGGWPSP